MDRTPLRDVTTPSHTHPHEHCRSRDTNSDAVGCLVSPEVTVFVRVFVGGAVVVLCLLCCVSVCARDRKLMDNELERIAGNSSLKRLSNVRKL